MITPITPISSSLPTVFDGIWLTNIAITANDPNNTVTACIQIAPWNIEQNVLSPQRQSVWIQDVFGLANTNQYVATAMTGILGYIQDQITSGSISFN